VRKASRRLGNEMLATLVLIAAGLVGCRTKVEPPPRHAGIPSQAVWAGGPDGGSWIACEPSRDGSANRCTVYHEHTGEVVAAGFFVARDTGRGVPGVELAYDGFDGERIYLKGNRILEPAKPP
jgi:hypothetical protein